VAPRSPSAQPPRAHPQHRHRTRRPGAQEHLIPKENIGLIEDIKLAILNYDTEEEEYEIKIGMIEDYYESPFPVELENTTHTF
jgi:galactose-1-phosphate uridylyltransferase